MWILGLPSTNTDESLLANFNSLYFVDICTHCIYHGVDFIYTFVDDQLVFDFKVWFVWFLDNVVQEALMLGFTSNWREVNNISSGQLYLSNILDSLFTNIVSYLPYDNDWFRYYLASIDTSATHYYIPELNLVSNSLISDLLFNTSSNERLVITFLVTSENLVTSVMYFPQYIMFLSLIVVFFLIFFNFFSSPTKEENIVDQDYLIALSLLESEEEISSFDDIVGALLFFVYAFFWFFYIYFWNIVSNYPEFLLILCLLPFIYVIIFFIPSNLLYDFGLYFVSYLRGSASTPNFLFEAMYDYIAIFALFIRLFVQGVRLLLMFFVYASLHDYILYWNWHSRFWLYGNYDIWRDLANLELTISSISYLFLKLPGYVVYWIYELVHTFFVITGQFIAFFAMVFWLFFYLYTFFTYEPQEEYLSFMKKWNNLKNYFKFLIEKFDKKFKLYN
jgi:hypothetical protein